MDSGTQIEVITPRTIAAFCRHVISVSNDTWPPDEQVISKEFAEYFQLHPIAGIEHLKTLWDLPCDRQG